MDDAPVNPEPPKSEGPAREECVQAMLAHVLGVTGSFLGPLIIWLMRGKVSAFVNHHAKEALNMQITLAAILLACWNFAPEEWFALLLSGYLMFNTVISIPAVIAASQGRLHHYPLPVRLID